MELSVQLRSGSPVPVVAVGGELDLESGPCLARWLRSLLRSLAADGRTVLVSSHLISEMALTAERLVVIGQGRLLADTTVAELSAGAASLEDAFIRLTSGAVEYRPATGRTS